MPWEIVGRKGQYCVVKTDGTTVKCHPTRPRALAHMRALYANEPQAGKEHPFTPDGLDINIGVLYNNSDGKAIHGAESMKHTNDDSQGNAAVTILAKIKSLLSNNEPPSTPPDHSSPLTIWKESGNYYWQGTFSNDLRDREDEVLTAKAHQTFAGMVEREIVDPPELWPWHIPLPIGVATKVWTTVEPDGHTYIHAQGVGYPEYAGVFKAWSEWAEGDSNPPLGMSHGMPSNLISRDPNDTRNIKVYVSKEVSVLPQSRAANRDTAFHVIEEGTMSKELSKDKLEFLRASGLSEEEIAALGKEATKESGEDLLSKNDEEPVVHSPQETDSETQETQDEGKDDGDIQAGETGDQAEETKQNGDGPEGTKEEPAADGPTPAEVAEAMAYAAKALEEQSKMIGKAMEVIQHLSDRIDHLEQADAAKLKAAAEWTPLASLKNLVERSVETPGDSRGDKASAKVDGRTTLGKDAPKETNPGSNHPVRLIATLQDGGNWRDVMPRQ